ncbi:MAG TPA: alpha/beta fold hydrolase [Acidimicrobiales bacterium]|nr:alpha/beta fold hydrolase [Acidimicrobiales bacterium]
MPSSRRRGLIVLGSAAAVAAGAMAYRRAQSGRQTGTEVGTGADRFEDLGWGEVEPPGEIAIPTADGARLAAWDVGSGPIVVLSHGWAASHAVWIPVARRLVESGHRVVLYDQRGHGASTRGTAPLDPTTLARDFALVLEARDVADAILTGHSMGGMTVMALATFQPELLKQRGRAIVLVATAAADTSWRLPQSDRIAARFMGSPSLSRIMRTASGLRFVRSAFGVDPAWAHLDLTRTLFADCDPGVRAGYVKSMSAMNLLEGIATIAVPTTVLVGSRDRLTPPARSRTLVDTIPGARLVTVPDRGHMLPLEDPDAVADEIVRAVKG